MSDNLRGITSPDLTKVVRAALQHGWKWTGINGTTHAAIVWPATGEKVTFGTTPGVASWKTTATEIERISGVKVWHKGNRKRSRKAVRPSGFNMYASSQANSRWSDRWGDVVDELEGELHMHITEFNRIREKSGQTRADINRAAELIRKIRHIESRLEDDFHQPVDRFEPVA